MASKNDSKNSEQKKGKFFILIGAVLAVTVIVLNFLQVIVVSNVSKSEIEVNTKIQYKVLAEQSSTMIKNNLETYFAKLDFYTKADVIKTNDSQQIWEWLKSHAGDRPSMFDYVAWCDADGKFLSDINSSTKITDRDYWQAIMQRGSSYYIDNPTVSKISGKGVFHICQESKVAGKTVGFFSGVITSEHISRVLNGIELGDVGYAVLFDSNGKVMSSSTDIEKVTTDLNAMQEKCADDYRLISETWGSEQESLFEIKNSFGQKQLVITLPIEYTPWTLSLFLNDKVIFKTASIVTNLLVVGGIILTVLVLLIVGALLFISVKPLAVVEKTIRGIASGDADLTKRIEIHTNNEIGGVVEGFNAFASKLQTIVSTMKNSKDELVDAGHLLQDSTSDTQSAIKEIISSIDSMSSNVDIQNESVHQTAGAVNEIASNIESLNRMIESQASSVTEAAAAVEQMIGNINSVNNSVKKMASAFTELEEKAQTGVQKQNDVNARIAEIEQESQALQEANTVISGIAEQTNLLAMNAAIEAAHAGEAGKGFSVVADEIRKLSEDSGSQSQTIGNQLSKITSTIEQIVSASQVAAEAFTEVSNGINSTNNLVREITNAMEEQNAGSHQISSALSAMSNTSNEVKTSSYEMAEGNKSILSEIKNLQDATFAIKDGMEEMSASARKINETGAALSDLSRKMDESINHIGEQVDQFKV